MITITSPKIGIINHCSTISPSATLLVLHPFLSTNIMVNKPKYFDFSQTRYDRTKFRSQLHHTDPKPFSPRWISGHGLQDTKRNKKYVAAPKTAAIKPLTKRSFRERPIGYSTVHIDHRAHRKTPTSCAPKNVYRVWDSTKPVPYRFQKRPGTTPNRQSAGGGFPTRPGKRMIDPPKKIYPDVPRFSSTRLFPQRKEQTFDKPNSFFIVHPQKPKKIILKKNNLESYIKPDLNPMPVHRPRTSFPRPTTKEVWRQATPFNSVSTTRRPSTCAGAVRRNNLMRSILTQSY